MEDPAWAGSPLVGCVQVCNLEVVDLSGSYAGVLKFPHVWICWSGVREGVVRIA